MHHYHYIQQRTTKRKRMSLSMTNHQEDRIEEYVQLQNQLWRNSLQEISHWNLLFGWEVLVVGFEGHVFE